MGLMDWFRGKKEEPAPEKAEQSGPPSPQRVARRALVLSLVMYRASLEQFPGEPRYEALRRKIGSWIEQLGLAAELAKEEYDLMRAPLGRADQRVANNSSWRNEGVAVLAWALKRFELPGYDEQTNPVEAGASLGFSEDLLEAMDTAAAKRVLREADLRSAAEIDRYAAHITIVNWRLRTFSLATQQMHGGIEIDLEAGQTRGPIPPPQQWQGKSQAMDFVGYLRVHPSFKESWLDGLHLVDGDLAIGGTAIADADPEAVDTCASTVVERHIAAYWLQGDNAIYAQVDPATILMGLSGDNKAADQSPAPEPESTVKAKFAYNRGVTHSNKGAHDQAIAEYTAAIQLDPTFAMAYYNRGTARSAKGDFARAIADYTQAIQLDPQHAANPYVNRGECYRHLGECDKAIADYDAAFRLGLQDAGVYCNRGLAYMGKGDFPKAATDFCEAIRLDANLVTAYGNRATAYWNLFEVDLAIADYTEVLRREPDNSFGYSFRGQCYQYQKEHAKAAADFTKALQLDPQNADTHAYLAWQQATCSTANLRDGKQALAHAQKACELTHWEQPWHFDTLAGAYAEVGQFDEALRWLKKALDAPSYPQEERPAAQARLKLYAERKPYREE